MRGFFSTSQITRQAPMTGTTAKCGKCGLYKSCQSPRMKPTGSGLRRILVVGEAPGFVEDEQNTQWVGQAGQKLRDTLEDHGLDLDIYCWKTNAVTCRPTETGEQRDQNRKPTKTEIACCRPNLFRTIEELKPAFILTLGVTALESLIPLVWGEPAGKTARWGGCMIPCQKFNCWISATIHPSAVLRSAWNPVLDVVFKKEIAPILQKKSRPWKRVPDYRRRVELLYNSGEIRSKIRQVIDRGTPAAWDLETNCLKPENARAKIYSCSISQVDGAAFAFPWIGESIIESTKEFLLSPVPKIAANMKFEDRWIAKTLGIRVRGWWWDTMIAAHILNCSSGGTGLKFLSFLHFGLPIYNKHLDNLLAYTDKDGINKIHEIDIVDLLTYNGLDSYMEKRLALLQRTQMGYTD